ncbi:uncharacterized protein LOC123499310 isoform X2 [Portunus trituberculatus]|uniref:uncharacterized protein LOC123499310 isoform X2 n=1 Tax=Portunus trituberculatus TaxID=210409 RepID=UPI001E1CCB7D|nr:uncharacterized protein LOC123499310 isoform X2 [Portunus trituberculatus]
MNTHTILRATLLVLSLGELDTSGPRDAEEILGRLTDREVCWLTEKYSIASPCVRCSANDLAKTPNQCDLTGYVQEVVCETSGYTVKSCQVQIWEEEVAFWWFEAAAAVVGVVGGLSLAMQRHARARHHRHALHSPHASQFAPNASHATFHCLPGLLV